MLATTTNADTVAANVAANVGTVTANVGTVAANVGTVAANVGTAAANVGTPAANAGTAAANVYHCSQCRPMLTTAVDNVVHCCQYQQLLLMSTTASRPSRKSVNNWISSDWLVVPTDPANTGSTRDTTESEI